MAFVTIWHAASVKSYVTGNVTETSTCQLPNRIHNLKVGPRWSDVTKYGFTHVFFVSELFTTEGFKQEDSSDALEA